MADPTQQMQQLLLNVETSFGNTNVAAQQLAQMLLSATRAGVNQTNAATATAQSLAVLQARSAAVSNGLSTIGSTFSGIISQSNSLASNLYSTDKAFTSVIPTLDALSSVVTKIITGIGQMGSGVSFLGSSFGRASEAVSKFATTGVEVVQDILKFQLSTAQTIADAFVDAVKAGASFSGSITRMAEVATENQIPMQSLVKIITNNVESLSKLGLGQEKAGAAVAAYTSRIFYSDRALRSLYGNFDELAKGVADYMSLQAQLGINAASDFKANRAAAIDYLYRQKELTAVTGKNAELLKKEEEARRTQLDYNLKLGRLGEEARKNVTEAMAIAGKVFNAEGAKYAEEYFATGGKVFSKSAQIYQATQADAAAAIANMIGAVDQSREGFRTVTGSILKDAAPALEAFARSNEDLAERNRAANNPIIASMTATSASIIENLTFLKNAGQLFAQLEAERLKREKQPLDAATGAFADAQVAMLTNQRLIDKTVLENMQSMGETIKLLNQVQAGFISLQSLANQTLNDIIKSGFTNADAATNLVNRLLDRIITPPERPGVPSGSVGPTSPTTPSPPVSSLPPEGPLATSGASATDPQVVADLNLEIQNLNRRMESMQNNNAAEAEKEQTVVLASILTEMQNQSSKLDRLRDAMA
jgi:hypothetical protein